MPYKRDVRTECEKVCYLDPLVTFTDDLDPGKLRLGAKHGLKGKIKQSTKSKKASLKKNLQQSILKKNEKSPKGKLNKSKGVDKNVTMTKNIELLNPSDMWKTESQNFEEEIIDKMIPMAKVKTCFSDEYVDAMPTGEIVHDNTKKYPITEAQKKKRYEALKKEKMERAEREKLEKELLIQKLKQLKEKIISARTREPGHDQTFLKTCGIQLGKKRRVLKCPSGESWTKTEEEVLDLEGEEEPDLMSQQKTSFMVTFYERGSTNSSSDIMSLVTVEEESSGKPSKSSLCESTVKEDGSLFDPTLKNMFDLWDDIKQKRIIHKEIENENRYIPETLVLPQPKIITFIDYENDVTYKTTLGLRNMAKYVSECVFYNSSPAVYSEEAKVIQNEVLRLASGMSGYLDVIFTPTQLTDSIINGRFMFIVRRANVRRLLAVPFMASRGVARPHLLTHRVRFPKVVWSNLDDPEMKVDFYNEGARPCTAVIEAINDEQIESYNMLFDYSELEGEGYEEAVAEPQFVVASRTSHDCAIDDVVSVLDIALDAVFDPFRLDSRLLILPPRIRFSLNVRFDKRYVRDSGLVVRRFAVRFEGTDLAETEVDEFTLECEFVGSPLSVKPFDLVLGHSHLDAYTCGKITFSNTAKIPYPLTVTVPSAILQHVIIYPSSPSIPARSSVDILIKLIPRLELFKYGDKHFNPSNGTLEFGIKFTPKIPNKGSAPPILVNVKAIVSPALGLQTLPKFIELGVVSTLGAIRQPIFLMNFAKTTQHFAFLNNHPFVQVQPNYGFGTICSGEKIELELVYSPTASFLCPWDPATPLMQQRLESTHSFELQVTTLRALSRVPRSLPLDITTTQQIEEEIFEMSADESFYDSFSSETDEGSNEMSLTQRQTFNTSRNTGGSLLSRSLSFVQITSEGKTGLRAKREVDPFNDIMDSDFNLNAGEETCIDDAALPALYLSVYKELGLDNEKSYHKPRPKSKRQTAHETNKQRAAFSIVEDRKPDFESATLREAFNQFHKVKLRAFVNRTFYELSHQFISLEPCPFYSYRILSFYLRANTSLLATIIENPDSSLAYKHQNVNVSFEFFSSDPQVQVQPKSGVLNFGQKKKLFLIFRPVLSLKRINDHILEMKEKNGTGLVQENTITSNQLEEVASYLPRADIKSIKSTRSRNSRRTRKFSTPLQDLQDAKFALLTTVGVESLAPHIRCLIQYRRIAQFPASTLEEVHDLEVSCASRKPDIVVISPEESILDFGRVAVGSHPKRYITMRSLSSECIFIKATQVDPLGPFYIPLVFHQNPDCSGFHHQSGILLKEGETYNLPVSFIPEIPGKAVNKYFEIISGLTTIPIQLKGMGVLPILECSPEFTAININLHIKSKKNLNINFKNVCEAPLNLYFLVDFVKEGPYFSELALTGKQKGKQKDGLSFIKAHDLTLYELIFAQFRDVTNQDLSQSLIEVPSENISLEPGKKATATVTVSLEDGSIKTPERLHSMKKSRRSETDIAGMFGMFAIRVKVLLDNVSLIRDWLIVITPSKKEK